MVFLRPWLTGNDGNNGTKWFRETNRSWGCRVLTAGRHRFCCLELKWVRLAWLTFRKWPTGTNDFVGLRRQFFWRASTRVLSCTIRFTTGMTSFPCQRFFVPTLHWLFSSPSSLCKNYVTFYPYPAPRFSTKGSKVSPLVFPPLFI